MGCASLISSVGYKQLAWITYEQDYQIRLLISTASASSESTSVLNGSLQSV